ncbi:MAG: hypothetical protein ACRD1S_19600 [Vicinamibacterales bacterium]
MDREVVDRRRSRRWPAGAILWTRVRLRPGREAALVNLCERGALVEGPARLHPGAAVVLQLVGPACPERSRGAQSTPIPGTVIRCHVSSLDGTAGVRYRGAIRFDSAIEVGRDPRNGNPE